MNYTEIMKTKAPLGCIKLIKISNEEIKPHFSSLTDYIEKALGYHPIALRMIDDIIVRLHIGAVYQIVKEHYGTALPIINKKGEIVGGNVQYCHPVTGDILIVEPLVNHLYSWYAFDYFVDHNTFFGEHLLSGRNIAIVQEEKTAILGMLAEPSIDWLAIGYGKNITKEMTEKLRGRRVVMFADALSVDSWKEKFGSTFVVSNSFVDTDINAYLIENIKKRCPP